MASSPDGTRWAGTRSADALEREREREIYIYIGFRLSKTLGPSAPSLENKYSNILGFILGPPLYGNPVWRWNPG